MIVKSGDATTDRVRAALEASGYSAKDITRARFLGVNEAAREVHQIDFRDLDGKPDSGKVYLWADGDRVRADF